MPQIVSLRKEWEQHPPLARMVQAYLGIKSKHELSSFKLPEFLTEPDMEE